MLLLLVHTLATLFMFGLIWVMQVVHYPLMNRVPPDEFVEFETAHKKQIFWLVAPAMLIEAVTAAALLFYPPAGVPMWLIIGGLVLVGVNALSTATLQGPHHDKLERGFDRDVHAKLVSTNWIRTITWSVRAVVALAMIALHADAPL